LDKTAAGSVALNALSNVTLPAGTAIEIALNGSDPSGKTVNFGATTSNPTQVAPLVMPQTNKSVQFNIDGMGAMVFQLFDNLAPTTASHIETLVNDGFYNGDYIYRNVSGFVVQGGNDPPQINGGSGIHTLPSGVPAAINEEFNPDLTYTSVGALGMARTGSPNTSGTEFFIAEGAATRPALDYSYTLFGLQTVDQAITVGGQATTVLHALEAEPVETTDGLDYLLNPIKIDSARVISDTQNGVLMLRAPAGVTGSFTVTVTAFDDGTNAPTTRTFTVNVVADTSGATTNPWASKTPAAPSSIAFQPQSGQGTTTLTSANNSSTSKELQFLVSGVTAGDQVTVYADGVAIGSANATSTSTVVTTNGTTALLDGTHTITATETALNVSASWIDTSGNSRTESANVDSPSSPGIQLQVFTHLTVTTSPATSATVGQPYTYTVQTNAPGNDAVTVAAGTLPAGMAFDAATQTVTWTPAADQAGTSPSFTLTVSDALGNSLTVGPVFVEVAAASRLIVTPADWTSAGLTLTMGSDGNLHVYTTGTTTDTVAPVAPASVTNIAIASPSISADNLTIDSAAGDAIPNGGLNYSGAGGLIITGPGSVVLLSSPNTYTGDTTVNQGTLVVANAGVLPDGTSLTVGAGGTFVFDPSQAAANLSAAAPAAPAQDITAATEMSAPIVAASSPANAPAAASVIPTFSPAIAATSRSLPTRSASENNPVGAPLDIASLPATRVYDAVQHVSAVAAPSSAHFQTDPPATPTIASSVASDTVFRLQRSAFNATIGPADNAQSAGAWAWLAAIESSWNSSDQNKTTDSAVAALDDVLARFGL
jgi:autotransporter-associated beta strand protein